MCRTAHAPPRRTFARPSRASGAQSFRQVAAVLPRRRPQSRSRPWPPRAPAWRAKLAACPVCLADVMVDQCDGRTRDVADDIFVAVIQQEIASEQCIACLAMQRVGAHDRVLRHRKGGLRIDAVETRDLRKRVRHLGKVYISKASPPRDRAGNHPIGAKGCSCRTLARVSDTASAPRRACAERSAACRDNPKASAGRVSAGTLQGSVAPRNSFPT
jgi:hypothetical protein